MQENHSDWSGVAQSAMVLGSGSHVKHNSGVSAQSADSIIQSNSTQEFLNLKLHAWLLEPHQLSSKVLPANGSMN